MTIAGTNFGTAGTVTFNAVAASTTSWTTTAIVATVPLGAVTGNVVVTSGGHSSAGFPFTLNNGPVSYVYDDLGRLAAVIDVNGNAAEYSYDSVGNILGISRFTSTQVSIIDFSPESGPVGTPVTINGTGFSTTPSQNTVKFNGTSATVSSATNNQLQVSVPTAATTGTISATSPNGSATSASSFSVTTSTGAPTITSFSPTSGVAGATVSLVGTNFDPTLANDKLRLNASQTVVSTVSPTAMATTVPVATASGHFDLLAPAGNAVSSQDFYVPFLTHLPGDIGFTARITPGVSQLVTLGSSKIAMLLFDGIEGQHVEIGWTGTTFSTCNLYLIGPDNTTTATTTCTAANTNLPSTYLPKSGTYTIGIDPGASSGSLTLTLSQDVVTSIAIGGPQVMVTTTAVGQDARLIFTADPGNRIVVYVTNVTNPAATVNLLTPAGTIQAYLAIGGSSSFMDTQTLATGGAYELWVQHLSSNIGSETLQIVSVPADFTGILTVPIAGATGGGVLAPASGSFAVGQNASLTFSGAVGEKLSFNVLNSTIGTTMTACNLTIYDPNNVAVSSAYSCGLGNPKFLDTLALASLGTYTAYIDPFQTNTGSLTLSINNDQDVTGPSISVGSGATPSTTVPGQDVRLSFAGTAGQRIAILVTNVSNPEAAVNLITPTGATLASVSINNLPTGQTFYIDTQSLPTTGTYQLWVQHNFANYGSESLQILSVPTDFSGTLTVPLPGAQGTAVRVPTTGTLSAGENASLNFSASSGQKLSFNVGLSTIGTSYASCLVTVTGPSPSTTQIASGYCGNQGGVAWFIDTIAIPSTGTYTVFLNPQGYLTGNVSAQINNDQDVTTPTITIGGAAVGASTTVAGQDVRLSFTPTAAQPRIAILASNVTNPAAILNLWTGTSTQASVSINNSPSGQTFYIDTQAVNANQQYQLWVQHSGTNFGNEGLQIKSVPADIIHPVTVGGTAYSFSTVIGQNANITFTTSTSESVTVHWTSGTYLTTLGCNIRVTGPSPSTNQVGSGSCNTATGTVSLGTIPSGTYNILIDPQVQNAGGMSLTLTTP